MLVLKRPSRLLVSTKRELEQLDFAIDAAKGGSDQLFRASQGVLGGFEAAAGAAALFGVENENLEATLVFKHQWPCHRVLKQ
jgi:hypothetical protein